MRKHAKKLDVDRFEGRPRRLVPILVVLGSFGKLELDSIHPIDAIDEENEDEDECDLQSVLYFRHDGIFGEEAVDELPLDTRKACAWNGQSARRALNIR